MIETREVSVRFGACVAVDGASVSVRAGEIHALVGENGAGKSTLLRAMAGLAPTSSGEVLVGGSPLVPATAGEAAKRGVAVVHQHFALVPSMTALENLMLGREPVDAVGRLLPEKLRADVTTLMKTTGLAVPLDREVAKLGPGDKQRIEILRGLVAGARALLLDEPTAVLVADEARELYRFLRDLAAGGTAVLVVTHALADVIAHADVVTVMRRGRVVHHDVVASTDATSLARVALGELPAVERAPAPRQGEPALRLDGLEVPGALAPLTLAVHPGEIVGIAGIEGAGQGPLVAAIAGLVPALGSVRICGVEAPDGVMSRRALGLETLHADRHEDGLVLDASVADNLVLGDRGGDEEAQVTRRLEASGAVPRDPGLPVRALSGGNQQKIVVARALDRHPRVLVASQPTRGVDALAAAHIHARLRDAAVAGAAVLLSSSSLEELRALSHRLVVLAGGRVVAELPPDADEAVLGRAMMGASS